MKKYLMIFSIAASLGLILSSCQSKNTPEYVADKFLTHLSNGEFEEASVYATEQTGQMLSMADAFAGDMMEERGKHDDLTCEIEGDKAICTYKIGDEIDSIDLVKQDGKWLVHQDK